MNTKIEELQSAFKKICPSIPGIFVQPMIEPWNLSYLEDSLIQDIIDKKVELNVYRQLVNVDDKKVRKVFKTKWIDPTP